MRHLVLPFLLGALVAGGAVWLVLRGSGTAPAEEPSIARGATDAPTPGAPRTEGTAPAGAERGDPTLVGSPHAADTVAALEAENRELEAKVALLTEQIEQAKPKPRDPRAFRFGLPSEAPSFDGAEWPVLAAHVGELTKVLDEIKDGIAAGEQPKPAQVSRIVKHNTPLAEMAVRFAAELDDENMANANAAYTHPAVIANLMRASLQTAELPFTEDQEIAIQALGTAWMQDQTRSAASIPPHAPALRHTVLEVDAKLRFLQSVKTVLRPEQERVLFNPQTEGRLKLDLLSPALVYVLPYPVEAADRADLETKLLKSLLQQAGVEQEDVASLAWIGREWVDAIPGVTTPHTVRDIDLVFPHVDQVQLRARAQVQATERLLALGILTDEQAKQLRALTTLLYPYVTARP